MAIGCFHSGAHHNSGSNHILEAKVFKVEWVIYVDGSSNVNKSGVGILLKGPNGDLTLKVIQNLFIKLKLTQCKIVKTPFIRLVRYASLNHIKQLKNQHCV